MVGIYPLQCVLNVVGCPTIVGCIFFTLMSGLETGSWIIVIPGLIHLSYAITGRGFDPTSTREGERQVNLLEREHSRD